MVGRCLENGHITVPADSGRPGATQLRSVNLTGLPRNPKAPPRTATYPHWRGADALPTKCGTRTANHCRVPDGRLRAQRRYLRVATLAERPGSFGAVSLWHRRKGPRNT